MNWVSSTAIKSYKQFQTQNTSAPHDCTAHQCQHTWAEGQGSWAEALRAECTGKQNSGYEMISTSLATAKFKQLCSQSSCRTMTQSTFFTQESIEKPVWGHPVHTTKLLHTPTEEQLQLQQLWAHWVVRKHTISTKNLIKIKTMTCQGFLTTLSYGVMIREMCNAYL